MKKKKIMSALNRIFVSVLRTHKRLISVQRRFISINKRNDNPNETIYWI